MIDHERPCAPCAVSRRIIGVPCQMHASSFELLTIEAMKARALTSIQSAPRYFQGPGTSGHSIDCGCAACRNFDD